MRTSKRKGCARRSAKVAHVKAQRLRTSKRKGCACRSAKVARVEAQRLRMSKRKGCVVRRAYRLLPRPSRHLPTSLAVSVGPLGLLGQPTWGNSVDRLELFGRPTAALRSTDSASRVDRHRRLGLPTSPTSRRPSNTCQGPHQYHGRL